MAIYLKYGSIPGAVTTAGFEKWIELSSFQWSASRAIGTAARGSTSREHSEPHLSEVTVTKYMDVGSPKLFLDSVAGKLDNLVTIKFSTVQKGSVETFLTFVFENTGVSEYSMSSGGDMPMESLCFNYTKMSATFTGLDPSLSGSPETVGYDLTIMKTT